MKLTDQLNHKIDRLDEKLDRVAERINSIDVTLGQQHVSLQEHMRRTALLEEQVELHRKEFSPVRDHVNMVKWGLRIIIVAGALFGSEKLAVLLKLF